MKRMLVLVAAAVAMAGLASVATAGDYHVGSLLICSDCHIMHGTASHAYVDGDTAHVPLGFDAPGHKLLRGETVNNACLTCHDGRLDAPDVLCDSPNAPDNGRRAGALNAAPNGYEVANTGTYTHEDGHSLFSTTAPPGLSGTNPITTEGLECTDCHGAHGNKYYRNMQGYPNKTPPTYIKAVWQGREVKYKVGGDPAVNPDTAWVFERLPRDYDDANVDYLEFDQGKSAYGEWCGACHGTFHGKPGDGNIGSPTRLGGLGEIRHPTAGVDLTSSNLTGWNNSTSGHRLKVMDATGTWNGTNATTMTPSCFTCHKSHGSDNKFGLIYIIPNRTTGGPGAEPSRSAEMTEEGDGGQLRDMCRNCHGMGSFPAGNPTNILP